MNNNLSANTSSIVSKVWNFCNTLRDDDVGYGECLNQDFQDLKLAGLGVLYNSKNPSINLILIQTK